MTNFYANMDVLGKELASKQISSAAAELQKFATDFGRNHNLLSFMDVGRGQDKTDHKCQEMVNSMLHIPSSRHVFVGACHDNGHLAFLDGYERGEKIKDNLSLFTESAELLESKSAYFDRISFPTVFRSETLNNFSFSSPSYLGFCSRLMSAIDGLPI